MKDLAYSDPKSLSVDAQPYPQYPWVEVHFTPPLSMRLHECLPEILALFRKHYDLREEEGQEVFPCYSRQGTLQCEVALFIRQRPGGREVPQLRDGERFLA